MFLYYQQHGTVYITVYTKQCNIGSRQYRFESIFTTRLSHVIPLKNNVFYSLNNFVSAILEIELFPCDTTVNYSTVRSVYSSVF